MRLRPDPVDFQPHQDLDFSCVLVAQPQRVGKVPSFVLNQIGFYTPSIELLWIKVLSTAGHMLGEAEYFHSLCNRRLDDF